nr:hypothetical protein [Orientia tsutsugamushi]
MLDLSTIKVEQESFVEANYAVVCVTCYFS